LSSSIADEAMKLSRERRGSESSDTAEGPTVAFQVGMAFVALITLVAVVCYARLYRRTFQAHWATKIARSVEMMTMTEEGSESKMGDGEHDPFMEDKIKANAFIIEDEEEEEEIELCIPGHS